VLAQLDAYQLGDRRGHPRVHSQSWDRAIPATSSDPRAAEVGLWFG
jgi:hypothetical protein